MKLGFRELLFFCLMLGLLASSYVFVFKPAAEKRAAREADAAAKRLQLTNLRQATAGISDLEKKISDLEKAIAFFESKLPQEKELENILTQVSQLAEQNNLQTRTVKTLRIENSGGCSEQPITMTLAGSFEGYYGFLQQLEKLSRIVRVNQMKLEKITAKEGDMTASMTLSIFYESNSAPRVAGLH